MIINSLATISEILADEGLGTSVDFDHNIGRDGPSSHAYTAYYTSRQRLKAEREWCGGVRAVNQLLRGLVVQQSRRRSQLGCLDVRKKDLTLTRESETANQGQSSPQTLSISDCQGLVLSSPAPILVHPALMLNFATQVFVPQLSGWEGFSVPIPQALTLLPVSAGCEASLPPSFAFPLLPEDPQAQEPFCIVLTTQFSLVMALGTDAKNRPVFQFSFDPEVVEQALDLVRQRTQQIDQTKFKSSEKIKDSVVKLENGFKQFPPVAPNYKTVTQFSRILLESLPLDSERPREAVRMLNPSSRTKSRDVLNVSHSNSSNGSLPNTQTSSDNVLDSSQVELIQAIAHEVRTPLATIHTLTRLLLKRKNFDPEVVRKRLEMIDHECTTQMDRFNLIFRAVELELSKAKQNSENKDQNSSVQFTSMSLGDIFQNSLPRWQKQATQRNHTLDVSLPQKLPHVVSDPTMLNQVLTGVIENFTRSLPSGSHIQVEVRLAGDQLKLQLESQSLSQHSSPFEKAAKSSLKSIGRLLMFQPETGALSLNMSVTKNLFEALGGKLVVRQRPEQGKVMTIFLPLKS
ncbi:MAG: HAMP domain-containing sensor histidine kinase [Cyanobacteriota bacterium]|nr:HAMP domain-containing sensor histidine kinase [Cyanobacteriota bacterium]